MSDSNPFFWACALLFVLFVSAPAGAEIRAVSALNGKVQGLYGQVDNSELEAGGASLSLPLGNRFGLQLDGAYGELGDDQLKGIGFHLFTRDPQRFLFGLVAAHAELEDIDLNRIAGEAELYHGPVTFAAAVGQQLGDIDNSLFATLDLHWYPFDELLLTFGGALADKNEGRLHFGIEYQMFPGGALFVDLAGGENDYDHAWGGLRFYLGAPKTLIKRHREDDPGNPITTNVLQGLNSIEHRQREIAAEALN